MMDRFFRAVFKRVLLAIGSLLVLQMVLREIGDIGCVALLSLVSVFAYLYRERSEPRRHFTQTAGSFERQRIDDSAAAFPADANAKDEPWT